MIPILYEKTEQDFSHNGIGFLSDAVKATVTDERNGVYEMILQYPTTGMWYDKIGKGAIIKSKVNDISEPQLFRVYKASTPLKGIVTYSAEHISYDLNGIPTLGLSVENATPQESITAAMQAAVLPCPFSAWSDITNRKSIAISTPCSVRSMLGGQNCSVLSVWGGEYEFDNFTVKLHQSRGQDNGVTIEYGKNLTDIKQEESIDECYTHILPYATYNRDPEGEYDENAEAEKVYIYLAKRVLPISNAENLGHTKAYIVDLSKQFSEDEQITEQALRAKALDFLAENASLGAPKVNLTVSFVQLWQTEEYRNIACLERVNMCDIVTVRFSKLGVESKAKVIKTVYDALKERYESITLGDAKETLADAMIEVDNAIKSVKQSTERIESHITRTDERITLEVIRSKGAEEELSSRITLTAESITAEVNRATEAEGTLSSRITLTAETITAEVTRATAAEGTLSSRIAQTAESITAEVTRATGAEEALGSRITLTAESITAEVTRAKGAENALSSRITQTADSITSEITRAKAEEAKLSTKISQTFDNITLSVSETTSNNQTTSTITLKNGSAVIDTASVTGTTAAQAATIVADAVNGITLSATSSGTSATLTMKNGNTTIDSATITFTGIVTFNDLSTKGNTTINGDNITTGTISADRIEASKLYIDKIYTRDTSRRVAIDAASNNNLAVGSGTDNNSNAIQNVYVIGQTKVAIGQYYASGYQNYHLIFDTQNRNVHPAGNNSTYDWDLGTSTYPFADLHVKSAHIGNYQGKVGFFGTNPASRQTVAQLGTSATLAQCVDKINSLLTALKNYGLLS